MQSTDYKEDYFRKTRASVGLLLKTRRPLWSRWVKIIRRHKPAGRLLDIGCGEGYFCSMLKSITKILFFPKMEFTQKFVENFCIFIQEGD